MGKYHLIDVTMKVPLPEDLLRRIDATAKWNDITREAQIRRVLYHGLEVRADDFLRTEEKMMRKYPTKAAALEDMGG